MPFLVVLPFIVIGIVIAATKKAAEQNKRAEAQRRANEMRTKQTAFEGQASYTPVRPSVQVPPVRGATVAQQPASTARKPLETHPKHEDCSLRPDSRVTAAPNEHPKHEDCSVPGVIGERTAAQTAVTAAGNSRVSLNFTPDRVLNGVIFSEIFGKPKALQ